MYQSWMVLAFFSCFALLGAIAVCTGHGMRPGLSLLQRVSLLLFAAIIPLSFVLIQMMIVGVAGLSAFDCVRLLLIVPGFVSLVLLGVNSSWNQLSHLSLWSDEKEIMNVDDLIEPVEEGNVSFVEPIIREQPELLRLKTDLGDTLLHLACQQRHAALVDLMLELGADPNARGDIDRTPLHCAVNVGDRDSVEIVKLLLQAGALSSVVDENGFTPLGWAEVEMDKDLGIDEIRALLS